MALVRQELRECGEDDACLAEVRRAPGADDDAAIAPQDTPGLAQRRRGVRGEGERRDAGDEIE